LRFCQVSIHTYRHEAVKNGFQRKEGKTGSMNKHEKDCRDLLSKNIKRYRNRIGLSQLNLALELGISTTFLSDIETGKKWVSAQTLSRLAKALKIEIYELFKPEQNIRDDVSAAIAKYLSDVDDALIKSIEEAVRPAVKKSITKMRRYYIKGAKK
jgi:transcriptional regulator with XRE-family HTH domain